MTPRITQPIKVGTLNLKHRVAFAPSTRMRADINHVPQLPIMKEYYSQRSKVPGTLLITEATFIAAEAGGAAHVPGIWSEAQIAAWKEIAEVVHQNGSFIYLQLWALGRAANPEQLRNELPEASYVSSWNIPLATRKESPRPMTLSEIRHYIKLYGIAADNAVNKAGFDGVEIHGANGYLIDQFLQDVSNQRDDEYGGSVENRARFALEVVESVTKAVGVEKTGIRISPWSEFQGMLMPDPKPTFSHVIRKLVELYPKLAYVHVVEPRGDVSKRDIEWTPPEQFSNDFIREIWAERPLISAGYGYDREPAVEMAERKGDITAFSRAFISNPDLPFRIEHQIPIVRADRDKFYKVGSQDPDGYTTYPFSDEFLKSNVARL